MEWAVCATSMALSMKENGQMGGDKVTIIISSTHTYREQSSEETDSP